MFSLKKNIELLDHHERRFQTAAECYLGAILSIQEHAIELTPELTHEHQIALRLLHRSLFEDLSPESLENSRHKLVEIMECYRQRAKACQAERDSDFRSMIVSLAMAAETMSSHNDTHSNRLKEFTLKLQETVQATDLGHIKRELRKQVEQLRFTSQSIWQENQDSSSDLQSKLAEFQARLERAEKRATTDALTSLLNRGEGEARLLQQLDSGHMTSVILIDLNGFKQINDRWGHTCGDQVLRVFSKNLEQFVRPSDVVCRWGGDEFLVLVNAGEAIARERAQDLRQKLRSRYRMVLIGKIFEIDISASVDTAQARCGESIEDLLARADTEMYQDKQQTKDSVENLIAFRPAH